jgi:molecular chaperone DnaK
MAIGLERGGGDFPLVFPRNAAIPNAKQIQATTSFDGQTELAMRIYQGTTRRRRRTSCSADFVFSGINAGQGR